MKHHLEHFHEMKTLTRKGKFLILSLFPLYFIVIGLVVQPFPDILKGLIRIVIEPDLLITDYFAVGGIGAAMINAGIITLISLAMIYFLKMEMSGHTITAVFLMFGFSLFGKNIMNIWAILAGVFLYSRYHKTSFHRYLYIGLYGTSLSPIMTQIMQIGHLPVYARVLISLAVGISIGFVLPPLSTHVHYAHNGYSLYNVGFAAGIIATVVVSLEKSFGIRIESRLIWSKGNQELFAVLLSLFFGTMIAAAVAVRGKTLWESYRRILADPGLAGADFFKAEGGATTVFNMGINGLFATFFCAHGRRRYERAYNLRYPYDRGLQLYGKTYTEYSTGYVWRISCKLYPKNGISMIRLPFWPFFFRPRWRRLRENSESWRDLLQGISIPLWLCRWGSSMEA